MLFDVLSYMQQPYGAGWIEVPDNWWHNKIITTFLLMTLWNIKNAIKNGYTLAIGVMLVKPVMIVGQSAQLFQRLIFHLKYWWESDSFA